MEKRQVASNRGRPDRTARDRIWQNEPILNERPARDAAYADIYLCGNRVYGSILWFPGGGGGIVDKLQRLRDAARAVIARPSANRLFVESVCL